METKTTERVATRKQSRRDRSLSFDSSLRHSVDDYQARHFGERAEELDHEQTSYRPARRAAKRALSESGLTRKVHALLIIHVYI